MIAILFLLLVVALMRVFANKKDGAAITWPVVLAAFMLLLLLCALPVFAQTTSGVYFGNFIWTGSKNAPVGASVPILVIPYSKVTVCANPPTPLTGVCTNTAAIFSDSGLTHAVSQPITTDALGQFGFYLSAGTYAYSVQNGNNQWLGNQVFTVGAPGSPVITLPSVGDVQAQANALFAAAYTAGRGLVVYLSGSAGASPISTTRLKIPVGGLGTQYSFIGINGATISYSGTGAVVDMSPDTTTTYGSSTIKDLTILLQANNDYGISTASVGNNVSEGIVIDGISLINYSNNRKVICVDVTGNMEEGEIRNSNFAFCKYAISARLGTGGYAFGPNGWHIYNNNIDNSQLWDIYVPITVQNWTVDKNIIEGGGCGLPGDVLPPTGNGEVGMIAVYGAQRFTIRDNYMEGSVPGPNGQCGSQQVLIKNSDGTGIIDGVIYQGNLSDAYGYTSIVNMIGEMDNIRIDGAHSGAYSTCGVKTSGNRAVSTYGRNIEIVSTDTSICDSNTIQVALKRSEKEVSEGVSVGVTRMIRTVTGIHFPAGVCTPINQESIGAQWSIDFRGYANYSNGLGTFNVTAPYHLSSTNVSASVPFDSTHSITFSFPAGGGALCGTPSGSAPAFVDMDGEFLVMPTQGGMTYPAYIPNIVTTTPAASAVACIKTPGPPVVLGTCSAAPTSGGTCTCN